MMKQEFEKLYGREIPLSVYEVMEELYMGKYSHLDKQGFAAAMKKQSMVEHVSLELLVKAESRIATVRDFAQRQKAVGDADYDRAPSISIDGLASKEMTISNQVLWTHNVSIMGLEKSVNMQRVLETLEA